MVNQMFKKIFVNQPEIEGSKSLMNREISVEQDLDLLANLAARLLAMPVATITLYDLDDDEGGTAVQSIAHTAISCDERWAVSNPDVDVRLLGSPRSAMTQHLGVYASVPLRNGDGSTIGMVACAGDEARELSDKELDVLKNITAIASAIIHS